MKKQPFETLSDGIRLRGELYLPDNASGVVMVPLCHGIPREGPREGDPGYAPLAERLADAGYGALIFNFRGCGVSEGDFDMAGWGRDLTAVAGALLNMPVVRVVVPWGFSGGAAASVWAAAYDERISAVALFACPADFSALRGIPAGAALVEHFREVGIIRDPGFPPDVDEWLRGFEAIEPARHIGKISGRPVLIIHGSEDETVPADHADRLMKAAGEPKCLRIISGAPHRLRETKQAVEEAFSWMKRSGL